MEERKVSSLDELEKCAEALKNDCAARSLDGDRVIPPPISRRQKWNFLAPFPEEVP
ncbi:hypothetical protein [Xanthomonas phaseoli]|uniref:hypothetical protein n=1 Tax=Xanthomonas phaseoli TaxID=1985254 RepID=UPI0019395BC9|nr:hypothetical protein [Xanthomonas phaseoli]MDM4805271.1 hypothetical protein [Xanthomonas phaseoli pv. phaseoli]